jgi:hypothetical protein
LFFTRIELKRQSSKNSAIKFLENHYIGDILRR